MPGEQNHSWMFGIERELGGSSKQRLDCFGVETDGEQLDGEITDSGDMDDEYADSEDTDSEHMDGNVTDCDEAADRNSTLCASPTEAVCTAMFGIELSRLNAGPTK